MTIAWLILRATWPFLLIGAAYLFFNSTCWSSACKDERAKVTALQVEKQTAQDRARDMALLWAGQVDKTEVEVKRATDERNTHFLALMDRAQGLDRAPRIVLSGGANGLLLRATDLANAAGSSPVSEASPDPVSPAPFSEADLAQSWTLAAQAYADAVGQWRACINFYTSLQLVQLQEQLH